MAALAVAAIARAALEVAFVVPLVLSTGAPVRRVVWGIQASGPPSLLETIRELPVSPWIPMVLAALLLGVGALRRSGRLAGKSGLELALAVGLAAWIASIWFSGDAGQPENLSKVGFFTLLHVVRLKTAVLWSGVVLVVAMPLLLLGLGGARDDRGDLARRWGSSGVAWAAVALCTLAAALQLLHGAPDLSVAAPYAARMAADRDHFEGSLAWLAVAAGMASLATIALVWQVLRTGAWRPGRAAWGGALVFAFATVATLPRSVALAAECFAPWWPIGYMVYAPHCPAPDDRLPSGLGPDDAVEGPGLEWRGDRLVLDGAELAGERMLEDILRRKREVEMMLDEHHRSSGYLRLELPATLAAATLEPALIAARRARYTGLVVYLTNYGETEGPLLGATCREQRSAVRVGLGCRGGAEAVPLAEASSYGDWVAALVAARERGAVCVPLPAI
ncbi:MAG: hypothetical protein KC731_23075 [Myxococcales bacterium]|nr:hypothetical protein [Myxococcales bacterium]